MLKTILKDRTKWLKHIILALIILNGPSFLLVKVNSSISSLLSIGTYILLILYYFEIKERSRPNMWLVFLGAFYFAFATISGQEYVPTPRFYLTHMFKFFVIIVAGSELVKRVSKQELFYFLLLGAISIILHVFFFFDPLKDSGRYSGFYLNPNNAGFICLMGYALCYGFSGKQRFTGQVVFTLMGLLTLSRTFILLWLVVTLLSIKIDRKNIRVFAYGFLVALLLVTFSDVLPISNPRLIELKNFVTGEQVNTRTVKEDARSETWSLYYQYILEKPFFGNGFESFSGGLMNQKLGMSLGVHNTYLKILGEAGIFVFILFLAMLVKMLNQTYSHFANKPYLFMIALGLSCYLFTNHNFFDTNFLLLFTLWIFSEIQKIEYGTRLSTANFRSNL